jgi:hypothetical protein
MQKDLGRTPETPRAVPMVDGKPDVTKLQDNIFYDVHPKGNYIWNAEKQKFILVGNKK